MFATDVSIVFVAKSLPSVLFDNIIIFNKITNPAMAPVGFGQIKFRTAQDCWLGHLACEISPRNDP